MRSSLLALALVLLSAAAPAATLKATLLVPADDPRLERTRVERAYLGHPGGPAGDGVQMALEESQFELDAAQAAVAVATQAAASLDAARAAALAAEKAGAAVLIADLPTDWLLAVVAIILGVLFRDESLSKQILVGAAIVVASVAVVVRQEPPAATRPEEGVR